MANDRIILAQRSDQLAGGETGAVHLECRGGDRVGYFGGVERVGGNGVFTGDAETLQRQCIGKDITRCGAHIIIATRSEIGAVGSLACAVLLGAIVCKRTIGAA